MTQDNSQAKVKTPAKSARRRARELALQGLYQQLLSRSDLDVVETRLQDTRGFNKTDRAHFDALLYDAIHEKTALTEAFTPYLDRPVAELSPAERAALLASVCGLIHCVDIPYKIVINEVVELIKTFGDVEGYKYVSGVLDKLVAQVRTVEVATRR